MKKNSSKVFPVLALAAIALSLTLAFAPLAGAQEQEYRQVWVQWYFLTGSSVGECNANCVSACMPTCFSTAAASGIESTNCGSMCPSTCAAKCPEYFGGVSTANDGLQIPQTPPGWSPTEPWSGSSSTESMPCAPGQTFCVTYEPTTQPTQTEGEPSYPQLPDCTPANGCYPGIEGVYEGPHTCPATASDGHPLRWDQIFGCYDIFWKEDYCGAATSCNQNNPCTGRSGCLWNGVACVPCNAPTCIYTCPSAGGGGGGNAGRPQQNNPVTVEQKEIPRPSPVPTEPVIIPIESPSPNPTGGATIAPTIMPSATVGPTAGATVVPTSTPTPSPTATPTPQAQCNYYPSCESCANAPKGADGKGQCGWSEFLETCIDKKSWDVINNTGLKAGWVDNKELCPNAGDAYCFKYSDCFSCAGKAGIKRRCQWSVKDNSCQPYDPLGDFKTEANPNGGDVILPNQCANQDCLQYSNCGECEKNAACLWFKNDNKCVPFNGGDTAKYYFYPGNCPTNASAPTPTPIPCPDGCKCDSKTSRVTTCGGSRVNDTGFVQTDRAAANAQAATSIEQLDGVTFTQQADGNASFVVQGHKTNTFLFVIPMRVDVSATVDAKTGAVEKVEQPWWSFFTG